METWELLRFPRVDPPGMSDRLEKCCTGTSAFSQISENTASDTASVVYFWLALCLITTPRFMYTRFWRSYFSGWFGCTAWALSAETMKPSAMAARISPSEAPRANPTRVSVSYRKVESAPCRERDPTSSLSNTAHTAIFSRGSSCRKARMQPQAHSRSSIRPQEKKASSAPQTLPGWRLYRNRSWDRISSGFTSAASASSFISFPAASPSPYRGSRSTWGFQR